jgi:hypothetical protein
MFGGAAAFEVRKRAALHSKRKEIRELKDQQHHLDTVLEVRFKNDAELS